MLPLDQVQEIDIQEFLDASGNSPFGRWFQTLNAAASARVTVSLLRMSHGNLSNVKGVGRGVYEMKIDFGPGYRVYFGKDGERVVILVGGSSKKRQSIAIAEAQVHWSAYKRGRNARED